MQRDQDDGRGLWLKAGAVWIALGVVLAATVAGAYLAPGPLRLPLALGLGAVKAALVVVVFMELFDSRASTRIAPLVGALFVALLFALSFADEATRQEMPRSFAAPPERAVQDR
ncbi:oxidase [Paracoccus sp. S-4012]|uniref:cytochrome C oxidase subunit IV family protein n=1 Tax=Paracoccus sp. S-4012 TaxID=2665648 RepID=UPI0012AF2614|nr:cytochrome C oxidase subunit IV family protein [Paracoccus sp. S-4012]MRX49914.1 oxidase [Paracoccus sp. S-4012]